MAADADRADTDITGRQGVHGVATLILKELGWIFREQHESDHGIDALVETKVAGQPTGRLVALQIKSGPSYFQEISRDGGNWVFRGGKGHRRDRRNLSYWLKHQLPVLVVLYNPDTRKGYWVHVNPVTAKLTEKGFRIDIPISNVLDSSAKNQIETLVEHWAAPGPPAGAGSAGLPFAPRIAGASKRPRTRAVLIITSVLAAAAIFAVPALLAPSALPSPAAIFSDPRYKPYITPQVFAVAVSADGALLATGDHDGDAYVWQLSSGKLVATFTGPWRGGVNSVAFSPGHAVLAVGDANGKTYLWNWLTGKQPALTDPGSKGVESVAFNPRTGILATADDNGYTYLWNAATGQAIGAVLDPDSWGVGAVAFSSDGSDLATGDVQSTTYLWRLTTDESTGEVTAARMRTLPISHIGPGGPHVRSVAFSHDDADLAVGDNDGKIYLWHVPAGTPVATLTDPGSKQVVSVAFSDNDSVLAAGDGNGHAYLWDRATRTMTGAHLDPGSGGVYAVAFLPDSQVLIAGDANGSTYRWN